MSISIVPPAQAEGTGGAPVPVELDLPNLDSDGGTGGGAVSVEARVRRPNSKPESATYLSSAPLHTPGRGQRASVLSFNARERLKHMPKKHVPHVATAAEDFGKLKTIGLKLNAVGTNFDPKQN